VNRHHDKTASPLRFPDLDDKILSDAGDLDGRLGPLPCGCYRIEVIDFGHGCGVVPRSHPGLHQLGGAS
jgi:hypothetical protein